MAMSGMSGMGMDMSQASMFTPTNKKIAHIYWYIVAAVVGLLALRRVVDHARIIAARKRPSPAGTTRSSSFFGQCYDTAIATCRELGYPQLWTGTGRISRFFTPPALGKCLVLLTYWGVILAMLWSNVLLTKTSADYAYRWEIVGFRAAWVSVTQLPLIYILSGKANIITLLTGISYERMNWLHRWVGRTIFLTVIVHWSYFFTEWSIADFVKLELSMMPMVKYGFGAWGTLGWMVLTGFGFFRNLSYELWFLQHLIAALVLLWLVHVHVPSYAQYNVWFAVGVVVFDRLCRTTLSILINLHLLPNRFGGVESTRRVGYTAEVTALSKEFLHVRVRNVSISWRPGQHVFLSIPRAGLLEAHPFTIASIPKSISKENPSNDIDLYLRVHSGFTKRLHRRCRNQLTPSSYLAFINGPWGNPPSLESYESLVLVATGNGASFTMPIFQEAVRAKNTRLSRISFVWIIRHADQLDWFKKKLLSAWATGNERNIKVDVHAYITDPALERPKTGSETSSTSQHLSELMLLNGEKQVEDGENKSETASRDESLKKNDTVISQNSITPSTDFPQPVIHMNYGRPLLDSLVRPVVEDAAGETGILACGGAQFTGQMRNYVAALSDERAVHKGTGAQGIHLFCETYGW